MTDPTLLLRQLIACGHEVFYADTDESRLATARACSKHRVIDAKKVSGQSFHHPEILIVVHTGDWHEINLKEYRAWPDNVLIEVVLRPVQSK